MTIPKPPERFLQLSNSRGVKKFDYSGAIKFRLQQTGWEPIAALSEKSLPVAKVDSRRLRYLLIVS